MGGITCTQAAVVDGNAAQPMAAHRGSCCCGRVCDHDRRISNVSFGISGTSDSSSTDKTQVVGPGQDHVAGEASARTYNSEGSSAVDPIAHASKRKSFYKDKPPAPKNQNARDRLRRLAKSGLLLKGIHLMLLAREFEEHLGCDDDMGDKRNEALAVPSPMDVQILSSGKPDKLSDGVSCPVKPQDGPVNPRHYRPDQSVHYWVEELHHHVIPSKQASFSKSALEKMLEKARVRWFGEDDQLSFHTAHRDPSGESTPTGNASWELGPSVAQAVPFAGKCKENTIPSTETGVVCMEAPATPYVGCCLSSYYLTILTCATIHGRRPMKPFVPADTVQHGHVGSVKCRSLSDGQPHQQVI